MDVVGRAHDFCFSFAQLARFVRGKLGLFESPSNCFEYVEYGELIWCKQYNKQSTLVF